MNMKKVLYISPFWPVQSGISEYSEILLQGLKQYYQISLLINNYKVEHVEKLREFEIYQSTEYINFNQYNCLIYNFGNNPEAHDYMYDLFLDHPGIVILHDFSLYYLTIEHYRKKGNHLQKIYKMEGVPGIVYLKESIKEYPDPNLLLHKELAAVLPMNDEIIKNAEKILIHSSYTQNEIVKKFPEAKTHVIPLVNCMPSINLNANFDLRKKFNIPENEQIIGSAGLIGPSKQCELCCQSILEYNKTHKQKKHYVMIGDGDYVDSYLGKYIHKTGFLKNEDFFAAIEQCDMIFNLRYPYNGESSATLLQCMMLKKTCVVTDIGWFSELSDEIVFKIPIQISYIELAAKIDTFAQDKEKSIKAYQYSSTVCSADSVAKEVYALIN